MNGVKNVTAPAHARRFGKARQARAASILEDYTELIADLHAANGEARMTDIANHLGVAHPTASKTIARLKREGLARSEPYRGVFLTRPARRWPNGPASATAWWSTSSSPSARRARRPKPTPRASSIMCRTRRSTLSRRS